MSFKHTYSKRETPSSDKKKHPENEPSSEEFPLINAAAPGLTAAGIMALQRRIGNRRTQQVIAAGYQPSPIHQSGGNAIQRTLAKSKVINALQALLKSHDLDATYQRMWQDGRAARIGAEIGDLEDTDKDNVTRRLRDHPEIKPLLKDFRLQLEPQGQPKDFTGLIDKAKLDLVYEAFQRLVCYHYSKHASDIRESGLDPNFGGGDTGLTAERSLVGRREQNLKAAQKQVFITRKYTEAKQYANGDEKNIVRLLVPVQIQQSMQVDADSQFGIMGPEFLKGVVQDDGQLNWWGWTYLMYEVKDEEAKANIYPLYSTLLSQKAIEKI